MNKKEVKRIREIREDDAVSPVIATILMVDLTLKNLEKESHHSKSLVLLGVKNLFSQLPIK